MKKRNDLYSGVLGSRQKVLGRYRHYFFEVMNEVLNTNRLSHFFEGETIKDNLSKLGIKFTFEVRTIPCGSGCNLYLSVKFEHGEYEYSKDLYKEEMKKNNNAQVCRGLQDFVVRANNTLLRKGAEHGVFSGDDILVEIDDELKVVSVVEDSCLGVLTTEGTFHLWEDVIGVAT
jgi:hypothetical protein